MKTINNILAIASIALSLTACSSDNESTSNNEGKEYPISLSVGIGDLSVVTRAESTTIGSPTPTPLTSGDLGLYIIKNGDKSVTDKYLCDNSKFTGSTAENVTTWSGQTYYWASDDATIDYIAYMPYKDDGLEKNSISATAYEYKIDWNVSTETNPDLLWQTASATNSANDHSIAITLAHACSKLTVNVSKLGSEIVSTGENPVTVSKIEINGMAATGTFNFTTAGEWSDPGVATSYAMKSASTTAGNKATYEAILIPQTAASTLMITLSNNATYQLSIPNQEYKMGTHYTITIQVGQDQVTLDGITQTNWETVTGGNLTAQ